jgi:hypothetical protein
LELGGKLVEVLDGLLRESDLVGLHFLPPKSSSMETVSPAFICLMEARTSGENRAGTGVPESPAGPRSHPPKSERPHPADAESECPVALGCPFDQVEELPTSLVAVSVVMTHLPICTQLRTPLFSGVNGSLNRTSSVTLVAPAVRGG